MEKNKEIYNLPNGESYSCPTCKTAPPERDFGYKVNKTKYPKYYNECKGFNGETYHDWDEVHFCKKCKIEYYFTNGAY